MYIGETERTLTARSKEHNSDFRLGHVGKSSVADHSIENNHIIKWNSVEIIDQEQKWYHRKVKEKINILKHPINMNKQPGVKIAKSWDNLNTPFNSRSTHHPQQQDRLTQPHPSNIASNQSSEPDDIRLITADETSL